MMLYIGFQPTPPTAHMDHHRDFKFGMDGHHGHSFQLTGAIIDKCPLSWDMGVGSGTPVGEWCQKIFFNFFFHFHWLDLVPSLPKYTNLSHNSSSMGNNRVLNLKLWPLSNTPNAPLIPQNWNFGIISWFLVMPELDLTIGSEKNKKIQKKIS